MGNRFAFVGNRRFVLQQMLKDGVNPIEVFAIAGSHLHRELERGEVRIAYSTTTSKAELIESLVAGMFDTVVSNGCPYILPISKLPRAGYVNIHPSCLPDLKGVDPVIGSVLHARDSGATCHVMDDGVDTGPIISQLRIPYSPELDVTTLYQLSFIAEQRVFSEALARDFVPQSPQIPRTDDVYYTRTASDQCISFQESNDVLLRKIKAFNNRSIGCRLTAGGRSFRVYAACRMENRFLLDYSQSFDEGVVVLSYEGCIVFRRGGEVLRFMDIVPTDGGALQVGERLF
jgi:methionyl-tRNA formyltransferase